MFASLRVRNYRLFAVGHAFSGIGTWMQLITQDWLVLRLTGSSTAVGVTTALQFLPMLLLGLYGGVLADRCSKRALLLGTQSVKGLTGLSLAVLTFTGTVNQWHVYACACVVGLVTVVDNPARQTFVSELVEPGRLRNAVSLSSATFQSAALVGPALAGVLITAAGSGWTFLLAGLAFLLPTLCLLLLRSSELHPVDRPRRAKGQLREGLRYVRARPELLWPVVLAGFVGTFAFNFPIWLTAFADGVFTGSAGMYGVLNSLLAAGALTGTLLVARRERSRLRLTVGAALAFGVLECAAAFAPGLWLFAALMLPIGCASLTFHVTANSSVQPATAPSVRGRVISLYMMVFMGGRPFGGLLMGWVTDTFGVRVSLLVGGVATAAAAMVVTLFLARAGGLRVRLSARRGLRGAVVVVPSREAPECGGGVPTDGPAARSSHGPPGGAEGR